jgi:hypothetical protein
LLGSTEANLDDSAVVAREGNQIQDSEVTKGEGEDQVSPPPRKQDSEIYCLPQRGDMTKGGGRKCVSLSPSNTRFGNLFSSSRGKCDEGGRTKIGLPLKQDSEMYCPPRRGDNHIPNPPAKQDSEITHPLQTQAAEKDAPALENFPRSPEKI